MAAGRVPGPLGIGLRGLPPPVIPRSVRETAETLAKRAAPPPAAPAKMGPPLAERSGPPIASPPLPGASTPAQPQATPPSPTAPGQGGGPTDPQQSEAEKPRIRLDINWAQVLGASPDARQYTLGAALVGVHMDAKEDWKPFKWLHLDVLHEPSLTVSLSLDEAKRAHIGAQFGVSLLNWHVWERNGDDILELSIPFGFSYDYSRFREPPRTFRGWLPGLSGPIGAQVEWHATPWFSVVGNIGTSLVPFDDEGGFNLHWGPFTAGLGGLIHGDFWKPKEKK